MTEKDAFRENLQNRVILDIVLSGNAGAAIRKWRQIFNISQRDIAEKIGIKSSIISDYESGRRKSPGAAVIKKISEAFASIYDDSGSATSSELVRSGGTLRDSIIDMRDMSRHVTVGEIAGALRGEIFADGADLEKKFNSYTVVDSIRAITTFSPSEFSELYGIISGRAVVFTGVERGRSPLVAIKVANIKPSVVIFHGLKDLDKVAERIAIAEKIPVIVSGIPTLDGLIDALKKI